MWENRIFSSDFAESLKANLWNVQAGPFLVKFNSDTSMTLMNFWVPEGNHVMKINTSEQHLVLMPWEEETQVKLLFSYHGVLPLSLPTEILLPKETELPQDSSCPQRLQIKPRSFSELNPYCCVNSLIFWTKAQLCLFVPTSCCGHLTGPFLFLRNFGGKCVCLAIWFFPEAE